MSEAGNSRALWVIGAVLTAALLGLLYASVELVEQEQWVGMRDEGRTQPMLAAGRMLRRMGIDAREVAQADWPAEDASGPARSLIVWNPPERLDIPRARGLTGWVFDGGHLLTTTSPGARRRFVGWVFAGGLFEDDEEEEEEEEEEAPSAGALQMSGAPTSSDDEDDDTSRTWRSLIESMGSAALLGAEVRDADGPAWVPSSRRALMDPVKDVANNGNCEPVYAAQERVVAISCVVRSGRVTVVDSTDEFLNHRLGENGHAAALVALVVQGRPGSVLIDLGLGDARPLLSWAVGRAPLALVLTGVAVVLLVWSRARRLGPAHDIAAPSRRALAEHLFAAGQFAWRHDRGQQLAQRLEASVRERAGQSIPGWQKMDAAAQATALAGALSARAADGPDNKTLPADSAERLQLVERALAGPRLAAGPISRGKESAHDYTARVRALNALWQALSAGSVRSGPTGPRSTAP